MRVYVPRVSFSLPAGSCMGKNDLVRPMCLCEDPDVMKAADR